MSWLQLARRTAIVTGAGSGIGAAVVDGLAAEGCNVVLADTNSTAMHQLVQSLPSESAKTLCFECNVTSPEQVKLLVQAADELATDTPESDSSAASLLVNCAGITRDGWIANMPIEDWRAVLDVNLTATYLTCRELLDQQRMKKLSGEGGFPPQQSIVNVGSIVSELGNLGQVNYSASKGGVLGLTRSLAKEVASRNVRVNAIVPGFIDTPMAQAVPGPVKEQTLRKIPMGRFGKPEEVANLATFLLSPRSSYITGEAIAVSGMISL